MSKNFRRSVALAGVLAIGGLVGHGVTTAPVLGFSKPDDGAVTREFHGRLDGEFTTVAPPPLLTLSDSVSGHATGLGKVTGRFDVLIDFNHPVGDGFVLVTKTGSLVAAGGRGDPATGGTAAVAAFEV